MKRTTTFFIFEELEWNFLSNEWKNTANTILSPTPEYNDVIKMIFLTFGRDVRVYNLLGIASKFKTYITSSNRISKSTVMYVICKFNLLSLMCHFLLKMFKNRDAYKQRTFFKPSYFFHFKNNKSQNYPIIS